MDRPRTREALLLGALWMGGMVVGFGATAWALRRMERDPVPSRAPGRPRAIEALLRVFEDRRHAEARLHLEGLAPAERADPWAEMVEVLLGGDDAEMRAFAERHEPSAPGARSLLAWVLAAPEGEQRRGREGVFAARYPASWIVAAWRRRDHAREERN